MSSSGNEEQQYLEAVRELIQRGEKRVTRNGAVTYSLFGHRSRYTLSDGTLPLLTTKKMFTRGMIEELLWFIRGSTNANELKEKGVHIWDCHSSRAHLDACGLTDNEEGDIGPMYGFQLRHFGSEYENCRTDYTGKGKDQLRDLIEGLIADPYSRRHVISYWNASDLGKMALAPCHILAQFYVSSAGELSCQMYQRSADIGLGVPFNIASYGLLTHLIAAATGFKAKELIYVVGDLHIYEGHVEPIKEQLSREPYPFPKIEITKKIDSVRDLETLTVDDFKISDYRSHRAIKMDIVM